MQLDQERIETYLSNFWNKPLRVKQMQTLGGSLSGANALKAFTYGKPLLIEIESEGKSEKVVLHQVNCNGYGRERDSDRVAEIWLNYQTFNSLPQHVVAIDLVSLNHDNQLQSCSHVKELLLLTTYAPGMPYANDLMRIRDEQSCNALDIERAEILATYLAAIHQTSHNDPLLWRRRLRDLVGNGEGIMGLTDSYPCDFALASSTDLREIEEFANRWRWKLKPFSHRLAQVHGDFHPFNILFEDTSELHLLDRSRGEWGEPADDVSCLSINYLFFSLQAFGELAGPFVTLYQAFWNRYLAQRADPELFSVIQPWYAWRALVLASPQWYPTISNSVRNKLLIFARRLLKSEVFDWQDVNNYWVE